MMKPCVLCGKAFQGYATCPYCRSNGVQLIPFETSATDSMHLGSDALLFVMAHGHTLSVPTTALYFAEKIAVVAIAARDVVPAVLADVNKAIDVIASSLRRRDRLDRDDAAQSLATVQPCVTPWSEDRPNDGPMARLQPQPINRPPSGQKVEIAF